MSNDLMEFLKVAKKCTLSLPLSKGTSGVEHASRGMMDTWWLDQKQAEAFPIRTSSSGIVSVQFNRRRKTNELAGFPKKCGSRVKQDSERHFSGSETAHRILFVSCGSSINIKPTCLPLTTYAGIRYSNHHKIHDFMTFQIERWQQRPTAYINLRCSSPLHLEF